MPRKEVIKKQFPLPDPVYNHYLIGMLLTRLMKGGKKTVAQNIVCNTLAIIEHRLNIHPIEIFEQAIKNVQPHIEVKARRFGGATYQVPVEVTSFRGINLALRWIIKSAENRPGKKMSVKLANELVDAFNNSGGAIRKKQEIYKMAESNKAFAHFRS